MNNRKNLITSIILQIITIISGLILPRLLISTFGSEVNGMVSSITQFLSFITLFEGGVGAAVLAELYKPIEDRNNKLIFNILNACNSFFHKLSISFIIYTVILMIFYPIFICKTKSFAYVSSLIFILSINTLMQYMFSITNRLLLQADQKIYITNNISTLTVGLNLLLTVIIIKCFPSIHLVKLGSSIAFLIQPIFYNRYVNSKYNLKNYTIEKYELKNQKSAFGQNLAHFINMNTDVILITIFLNLTDVSIYTVYLLALNALRNIIVTCANSYQAALGKYIAQGNIKVLTSKFKQFVMVDWMMCTILFSTCLLLINQFVGIYTTGIKDAVYYQPIFALIMCLAYFVYCIREPFRLLILAAGKFKETNFGAYMEAIINIVLSLILINFFGLAGVALGTLIAITYRFIYFLIFLKNNIIYLDINNFISKIIPFLFLIILNIIIFLFIEISIKNFLSFIIYGFLIFIINSIIAILLLLFDKKIKYCISKK